LRTTSLRTDHGCTLFPYTTLFRSPAVDLLGRGGIDAEYAVQAGRKDAGVGLAGFGDATHLPQRLRQSGQGEGAIVHHAAAPRMRCSSAASVAAMTAPPRQASPS